MFFRVSDVITGTLILVAATLIWRHLPHSWLILVGEICLFVYGWLTLADEFLPLDCVPTAAARMHPDRIGGLVLVDPTDPTEYANDRQVQASLIRRGVTSLISLPGAARPTGSAIESLRPTWRRQIGMGRDYHALSAPLETGWLVGRDRIPLLGARAHLRVVDGAHLLMFDAPAIVGHHIELARCGAPAGAEPGE